MTRVTATEFQRHPGRYQDEAALTPVVITKNGRERLVLLSVDQYRRLKSSAGETETLAESSAVASGDDFARPHPPETVKTLGQTARAERALVARAEELPEVRRMIEFGSRTRSDARHHSDLDVAVSCPTATPERWVRIYHELQDADTLLVIDLHRLEDVSAEVRLQIEREGRVIYEQ